MGIFARHISDQSYIRLLLHWRWLVLAIAIPVSVVIEIIEGSTHDLHFLDEVFIDGMIVPVTTWAVLTVAAKVSARQFDRQLALEQRQEFMQRLAQHRDYFELTHFLVRFPASLMPVEYVALFTTDGEPARPERVAEWSPHGNEALASQRTAPADGQREYRLVLLHGSVQIGVLLLRCEAGKQLPADKLLFLTTLAPEMALALALAIADAKQARQVFHDAQVYERRRITQELHDSLAQQVFYLHLGLDQLTSDPRLQNMHDAVQPKILSMRDVAAGVYEQIRNNLSILRAWEQVNLTEAISELARVTARNTGMEIAITLQGEPGWLSPHSCEHIFGIVREALNNVVKHARAQHVQLDIAWSAEQLGITLADDGIGFVPEELPGDGHYGLALMREAAEALHGSFTLYSNPGQGTRMLLHIPLHATDTTPEQRRVATQPIALEVAI